MIDKVVHDDTPEQLRLNTSINHNNQILKFDSHDMNALMIIIAILQIIQPNH